MVDQKTANRLIVKYIQKEITIDEQKELDEWLTDAKNMLFFKRMTNEDYLLVSLTELYMHNMDLDNFKKMVWQKIGEI